MRAGAFGVDGRWAEFSGGGMGVVEGFTPIFLVCRRRRLLHLFPRGTKLGASGVANHPLLKFLDMPSRMGKTSSGWQQSNPSALPKGAHLILREAVELDSRGAVKGLPWWAYAQKSRRRAEVVDCGWNSGPSLIPPRWVFRLAPNSPHRFTRSSPGFPGEGCSSGSLWRSARLCSVGSRAPGIPPRLSAGGLRREAVSEGPKIPGREVPCTPGRRYLRSAGTTDPVGVVSGKHRILARFPSRSVLPATPPVGRSRDEAFARSCPGMESHARRATALGPWAACRVKAPGRRADGSGSPIQS